MKKVVFFVHCLRITPSTQRRVLDYQEYLISAGIQPCYISYTNPGLYEKFTKVPRGSSPTVHVVSTLVHLLIGFAILVSRWFSLVRLLAIASHADAVFIQWVTPPPWYTSILRKINPAIVYDLDDALFLTKPRASSHLAECSRLVFPGSHYNLNFCSRHNTNCVFLPTPVPVAKFIQKDYTAMPAKTIIGWIGSISTLPYLRPVADVLDRVAEKHPDTIFRVVGCGNRPDLIPKLERMQVEVIPLIPYEQVPCTVREFDIGIMPLLEDEWSKGKCVGKALEYMAASVPCVISRFGENIYAVSHGKNGMLAGSDDEWLSALLTLIEDREMRVRIGRAGRASAEEIYDTKVCADILIDNLLRVVL